MRSRTQPKHITTTISSVLCSVPTLFLAHYHSHLHSLPYLIFLLSSRRTQLILQTTPPQRPNSIKVYVANLPRSLHYGLLDKYWSSDARLSAESDRQIMSTHLPTEYWIMGDLLTAENLRTGSFAKRVFDVVFVSFFTTLSAECS